jgi:histone H3/H4
MVEFDDINVDDIHVSKSTIKRIADTANVHRMTDDAAVRVAFQYEVSVMSELRVAKELASHAGRQTVKEEDLILAERMKEAGL